MISAIQSLIRYRLIDQLLTEKAVVSLEDLTSFCRSETGDVQISAETIQEDIYAMQKNDPPGYSAPISFDDKKGTYFYSNPGFSLNKMPLTTQESEVLDQAVLFLSQLKDHESLKGLKGMIQKITDTIKIKNLSGTLGFFDFVQSEIPHSFGGSQFLQPLVSAIQNKKVIRLYYHPFYEDKPYFTIVHPYLLKEYRNRWYLIGLNDNKMELRTYGLDRIWEIHELGQVYIPPDFSPKDFFQNTIGVISPMGNPPDIRISVLRHQANYLITQPLHQSQFIELEDEERVIFHYKVHPTYELKSEILSMGSNARVLSPESLKKDILRQLNDAILEYGKPDA